MSGPSPHIAALLTWLVPGGGHLYIGRARTAVIAFLVIQGLYLAGVALSGGLFLSILPPEMRGTFAAVLTPEAGNLGALIVHVKTIGFGGPAPNVFPATLHLGMALTAAAGILNLALASRAHFEARSLASETIPGAAPDPGLAVAFAWLVPGGGHFAQGRIARGVVVLVLLGGLFALGTALADGVNLDRTRHFYYWGGQVLLGPLAIATEVAVGHPRMPAPPEYGEAGVVIASIAGMLNILVMLDVYGWSDARLHGRPIPSDADDGAAKPDGAGTEGAAS